MENRFNPDRYIYKLIPEKHTYTHTHFLGSGFFISVEWLNLVTKKSKHTNTQHRIYIDIDNNNNNNNNRNKDSMFSICVCVCVFDHLVDDDDDDDRIEIHSFNL